MHEREQPTLARRGFLSGLAGLPLIGGGVALIGQPTAAAVPVTDDLLWSYKSWLHYEHRMVAQELARYDQVQAGWIEKGHVAGLPGDRWHFQWSGNGGRGPAGWQDAPQPSTRAAIVLSAVGCPLLVEA